MSTVINTGQRNIAAVAGLNDTTFLRLTTSVRQNITTVTRDDPRTTLDMINLITGENSLIGVVPENPITSVFGTTRANVMPRQLVVDSTGTMAYAITLSGLSVIPLARATSDTRPVVTSGALGVINSSDGTGTIRPGSFITITRREPRVRGGGRNGAAADGAGRVVRDLRGCLGAAAANRAEPDRGAGSGYAASRDARGRGEVAFDGAAERPDSDRRAGQLTRARREVPAAA